MHLSASLFFSSIASLSLVLLVAVPMVHTAPLDLSPYSSSVTFEDQDTKPTYRVRSEFDARNISPVPRASQRDINIDHDDSTDESLSPGAPGLDREFADPVQSHSNSTALSFPSFNTISLHQYPRAIRKYLQKLPNLNLFSKTIYITITFLEPILYVDYLKGSVTTPSAEAQATLIENIERLLNEGKGKLRFQGFSNGESNKKVKLQINYNPIHGKKNPYYVSDSIDARFQIKVVNVHSMCGIENSGVESCYGTVGWGKGEKRGTIRDEYQVIYP
ncbi:hypothetical protein EV368DRAFT_62351 [Lentinula lateritia]|nr:hypothetical protein EV368DRAFT_62351 [Lentinula lateritia]